VKPLPRQFSEKLNSFVLPLLQDIEASEMSRADASGLYDNNHYFNNHGIVNRMIRTDNNDNSENNSLDYLSTKIRNDFDSLLDHNDTESNNHGDDREDDRRSSNGVLKTIDYQTASSDIDNDCEFLLKWKLGKEIGNGAFGRVYLALLSNGSIVAVKKVEIEYEDPVMTQNAYNNVREEVKILKVLNHVNIVQ
jgi:hypothetical protein